MQGFCVVVGWRAPSHSNGRLLGYDVHFYTTSVEERLVETVNSDQTYLAVEDDSVYKQSGTRVRVRCRVQKLKVLHMIYCMTLWLHQDYFNDLHVA